MLMDPAPHTVTATFFGICTHIHPELDQPEHQVVLVNADTARIDLHPKLADAQVGAHEGMLQLLRSEMREEPQARPWLPILYLDPLIVIWKLQGVRMQIGHAVRTVFGEQKPPACIPHLGNFTGGEELPRVRTAGVDNEATTACLFTYPSSQYLGKTHNPNNDPSGGAAVAELKIGTTELPTIELEAFGGGQLSIKIADGAQITISNAPRDGALDKDADFMLHFLALDGIPGKAGFPVSTSACDGIVSSGNLPRIGDITTPGCSNSNYP